MGTTLDAYGICHGHDRTTVGYVGVYIKLQKKKYEFFQKIGGWHLPEHALLTWMSMPLYGNHILVSQAIHVDMKIISIIYWDYSF